MMTCHYLNRVVEDHKRCLAERAAAGLAHVFFSCGQEGHILPDCPGKVAYPSGPGDGAVHVRRGEGAVPSAATQEELPRVAAPAMSMLVAEKAAPRSTQKRPGPLAATAEMPHFPTRARSGLHLGKPRELGPAWLRWQARFYPRGRLRSAFPRSLLASTTRVSALQKMRSTWCLRPLKRHCVTCGMLPRHDIELLPGYAAMHDSLGTQWTKDKELP
jgi:hypothetical protein